MVQGIPERTPDVDMRFPRTTAKVTSQECVGQNDRQTRRISTTSMDAHRGTSTDAHGSTCIDAQTCVSTSKDACGSTCMDDLGSACTDVSTDSTGVHGITCPYIPTKGMGRHGVTSTHNSTVKAVVHCRMNAYENYVSCEPIQTICTDIVGKVQKGISYADALDQGS